MFSKDHSAEDDGGARLALIERERRVLGEIAAGAPLGRVLEDLLLAVEAHSEDPILTSILFLSEDGLRLQHGAAPSLPDAYNRAIDGIAIGEGVGSCGTVASRGAAVYADDIATDPLWRDFRDLALSHGLRACWSTPIQGTDSAMLGTFAIYYGTPRAPTADDVAAIAFVTQTAALAIERHVSDLELRREIEAGRRQSRRLATAIDVARLGAFEWNPASGAVEMDGRARAIFELPAEGPVTQADVFGRIAPEAFETVSRTAQEGFAAERRVEIDYPLVLPKAGRRIVRSLGDVTTLSDGGRGMAGVFLDVTAEKQAEALLRREKVVLEQEIEARTAERTRLWRTSLDLLVVADPDTRLDAVNHAWTTRLGWSEDELVGRPFTEFIHPDDEQATLEAFAGIVGAPLVVPYEYRLRHKDGGHRWFAWTAAFENGKIAANGRDVTAAREQAESLAQTEAALRQAQKMEAVGQLTGGLAHDFNNLLTGISGSLELLQTRLVQGRFNDVDRYVNAAQGAAKRAAALTHRLLAFSRRQTLAPKSTDVNRLVAGMEELIRRSIGPAVSLQIVGAASLWPALVDPPQLENALLNLCINARDAMPDGGKITIETANKWLDERAAARLDMPQGQYLSLCVTDTGAGMTPEVMARVFDPFFTTKPIGEGTGLGLSMIYGFAKQSGGQVRLYSEVDEGTTVCIYLPRHLGEGEVEEAAPERTALAASQQGETVLVVDDEPTVRMLVADILGDLGYVAVEAADSRAGLKMLESEARIDLLVTDVGLPGGMNGRQMADAARVKRPELKVLFITGYAENAVLNNGQLAPGLAIMTKPFAVDAMAVRIRTMMQAGPTRAE